MAELQIVASANQGQLAFNKAELKAFVEENIKKYEIEVTEDNIKEAKKMKADLNKISNALDSKRKEIKNQYCEPLVKFENDVKEVKAIIDEGVSKIGVQLNKFDERFRENRQLEIAEYFISKEFLLVPLEKIFDSKWMNKTCKDWKEQIDKKIETINQELELINNFGISDEEKEEIKGYYLECLNVMQARNQFDAQKERREQIKKLQENKQLAQEHKQAPQAQKQAPSTPLQEETPKQVQQVKLTRWLVEFVGTDVFKEKMNVVLNECQKSGDVKVKMLEKGDVE